MASKERHSPPAPLKVGKPKARRGHRGCNIEGRAGTPEAADSPAPAMATMCLLSFTIALNADTSAEGGIMHSQVQICNWMA